MPLKTNHARQLMLSGRLKEAREIYRQLCVGNASDPDAWYMLGSIEGELGAYAEAIAAYRKCIALKADAVAAYEGLGMALGCVGDKDGALAIFSEAVKLNPGSVRARYFLGRLLQECGKPEDAIRELSEVVRLHPGLAEAHSGLGMAHQIIGNTDKAEASFRRAVSINPGLAEAHSNLGYLLENTGKIEQAETCHRKALALQPRSASILNKLGLLCSKRGAMDEAVGYYRRALILKPDFHEVHNNLGLVLRELGKSNDAEQCFRQAVRLKPDYVNARINLGLVLKESGRSGEAEKHYRIALEYMPDSSLALANLGILLQKMGCQNDSMEVYQRALALDPGDTDTHSNMLMLHVVLDDISDEELFLAQRKWDELHGGEGRKYQFTNYRTRGSRVQERLRIGYVSADLRTHAVSYFFEPLLRNHDKTRYEIFCYSDDSNSDTVTERLRSLAEHWCSTEDMNDVQLAQGINVDEIDILVDLSGHTAKHRLKTFTFKPAPVQATYLGYFASTGLASIDYWITDEVVHPLDTTEKTVEKIHRLSRCSHCYLPPADMPPVSACPNKDERVVFASISNLVKLTGKTLETWGKLLQEVPGSRLLITTGALGDAKTRKMLSERCASHGVDVERLTMQCSPKFKEWIATYREVDIVLDPFPRTGCTTTAEALWMGVPVVTLAGVRYAGRASAGVLTAIGLDELIAEDRKAYVDIAARLARDPSHRAELRENLRGMMLTSPLCDGEGLALAMENAFNEMWAGYLSSSG